MSQLKLFSMFQKTRANVKLPEVPERLKGGRMEKWANYWKNVLIDYKEAFVELAEGSKAKPVKATIIGSTLAGGLYANKTNPDQRSFNDAFVRYGLYMIEIPKSIRNEESERHQSLVNNCFNHGLIRRWNLGVFSVMWMDNFSDNSGRFPSQCKYLKVGYFDFLDKVVDVGFLGRWWIMEGKLREADINKNEWNEDGTPKSPDSQLVRMW